MKQTRDFDFMEHHYLKNTLRKRTGYYFHDKELLLQIFTPMGQDWGQGKPDCASLSFMGDSVLAFCLSKLISRQWGSNGEQGEFTLRLPQQFERLKSELISPQTLSNIIDEWEVAQFLLLPSGANPGVTEKAGLFRAILGGVAVASNWDNALLETAVVKMLSCDKMVAQLIGTGNRPMRFGLPDAPDALDAMAQRRECSAPQYSYACLNGGGQERYVCTCLTITPVTGILRQVLAPSKLLAQRAAAYLILCEHYGLANEYGSDERCEKWTFMDGKLEPYGKETVTREQQGMQQPFQRPTLKFHK